jgi:membrane protein
VDVIVAYCKRFISFWRWVFFQFWESRSLTHASSLTFSSLLALVPLTVVMFSTLSFFPIFKEVAKSTRSFVFSNFIPSTGATVEKYVDAFQSQAGHLPFVGFVFLVITAILMMTAIESALNRTWEVRYQRHVTGSILLYWAMVTLGPLLLAFSVLLSSYFGVQYYWHGLPVLDLHHLLRMVPFLLTIAAFCFLYMVVPHCKVKFWHALLGSVIAAILFEIAKRVFGFYVLHFPTYALLYGSLATLPLFLLWVYFSWVIFLFGAMIVNGLRLDQAQRSIRFAYPFVVAVQVIGHLYHAQENGQALSLYALLKLEPHCSVPLLKSVLDKLKAADLIYSRNEDDYLLQADLHLLSLKDLAVKLECFIPVTTLHERDTHWQKNLCKALGRYHTNLDKTLGQPLFELYSS